MTKRLAVTFLLDDLPGDHVAVGRDGQTLLRLVRAGEAGITTLENPAPRLSHYIFKLRRMGLDIETQDEAHGGIFAGVHGRYRLRSKVRVVDINGAESEAA